MENQNISKTVSDALIEYFSKQQNFNQTTCAKNLFSTSWKACIEDLKIQKLVVPNLRPLAKESFGSTIPNGNCFNILINENFINHNQLPFLLITTFHELRHVHQAQTNFQTPYLKSCKITTSSCDISVLELSKTKLGISPYYFYFTSGIENDAREYSFDVMEKVVHNLEKAQVSKSVQKQIYHFCNQTKKYIQKERTKYIKFLTKMSAKQDKIIQKIKKLDKILVEKINNSKSTKNNIDNFQLAHLANIYMDQELKLGLFDQIKQTQDSRLANMIANINGEPYSVEKYGTQLTQTEFEEISNQNYENIEIQK